MPAELATRPDITVYVDALREEARAAAEASRATATRRAYAADWRAFEGFAATIGCAALPADPETVALYVRELASRCKAATISRKLSTIAVYHGAAGLESPTRHAVVRAVLRGTRRQLGVVQKQKKALRADALRDVITAMPSDLRGLRDRAVLLVAWSAALRRSELAALRVADVVFEPAGMLLTIRSSKSDQEGAGSQIAILFAVDEVYCPVRAVRAWMAAGGVANFQLFRRIDRHGRIGNALSAWAVGRIVKERGAAIGLVGEELGGHSLRSGFASEAAATGIDERSIMRHGRWASVTTARRYI